MKMKMKMRPVSRVVEGVYEANLEMGEGGGGGLKTDENTIYVMIPGTGLAHELAVARGVF